MAKAVNTAFNVSYDISLDTCYGTTMYKHGIDFLKCTGNETIQTRGNVTIRYETFTHVT